MKWWKSSMEKQVALIQENSTKLDNLGKLSLLGYSLSTYYSSANIQQREMITYTYVVDITNGM